MKSRLILSIIAALFVAGCTTTRFIAYVGEQQNWPTAPGAMMETVEGYPVYYGHPPKPYQVLGTLDMDAPPTWTREMQRKELLKLGVKEARARGADGIIVAEERTETTGSSNRGTGVLIGDSVVATSGSSTADVHLIAKLTLIKFK